MALMSVKRYLTPLEEEDAYRRVVSLLLDGIAAHALNLDQKVYRTFCERIGGVRQAMASETTVESLMADAREAVQAIGDYARETGGLVRTRIDEMQNTIATLTERPVGVRATEGRAEESPRNIGGDLGLGALAQDVPVVSSRPQEPPGGIREETARQTSGMDLLPHALSPEVCPKHEPPRSLDLDPVTQLPGEEAARAPFVFALHSGEQRHVAVFVLGSAQRINLRFGRAVGDEVVRELKRYVVGQLQPGDRMFRWPGPAMVALLACTDPFDRVRARLKRFLEKPIEREFDINGRSVLIPLTIAWSVFPVSLPLAGLNRQIHDFVAGQGYRDEDPVPA